MSAIASHSALPKLELRPAQREPWWVRWLLIGSALTILSLLVLLPLITVFAEALRRGWEVYLAALTQPDALSALKLTLTVAAVSVPVNVSRHDAHRPGLAAHFSRGSPGPEV